MTAWDDYPEEKLDALFNMKSRVLKCVVQDGGTTVFSSRTIKRRISNVETSVM